MKNKKSWEKGSISYCFFLVLINPLSTNRIAKTIPAIGAPVSCILIVFSVVMGMGAAITTVASSGVMNPSKIA